MQKVNKKLKIYLVLKIFIVRYGMKLKKQKQRGKEMEDPNLCRSWNQKIVRGENLKKKKKI